jgi:hypothetical protein
MGIPLYGSLLLVLVANSPVIYCRARKAEDHLPPSRPGDTPRQAGLARRPGDGACVSTYGVGVGWHGAFPWQCAGRRRCCGCPAERIARGAFLVAASAGTQLPEELPGMMAMTSPETPATEVRLRRSHQHRSTYQRAHPFSRSPAGRAERRADRDCLGQRRA